MKIKRIMMFFIFFCTCFLSFAQNWDINTLRNINVNRNEKWDNFNIFMSKSAPYIALGFPIAEGGISLFTKNPTTQWKALELGTSIGITVGLTYITKHVINRERPFVSYPEIQALDDASSPSFPSGHTSSAFALATTLSLQYPKWYVIAPSYLWSASVAYSRLHNGVHYPSDVIGGIAFGVGFAFLTNYLYRNLLNNYYCKKLIIKF